MRTFLEGIQHITDLEGYDHMLFLLALCAPFAMAEWKKIVLLATAFTIGHSITLALAALDAIRFSSDLIELLIPITIMLTAAWNVISQQLFGAGRNWIRYTMAAFFGLIHGMGFSSYFRMMFNETADIVKNLFLFNLGVELGQIIIICVILLLVFMLNKVFHLQKKHISIALSAIAFCMAAWLVWGKISVE